MQRLISPTAELQTYEMLFTYLLRSPESILFVDSFERSPSLPLE